jgi:hypothetical protein
MYRPLPLSFDSLALHSSEGGLTQPELHEYRYDDLMAEFPDLLDRDAHYGVSDDELLEAEAGRDRRYQELLGNSPPALAAAAAASKAHDRSGSSSSSSSSSSDGSGDGGGLGAGISADEDEESRLRALRPRPPAIRRVIPMAEGSLVIFDTNLGGSAGIRVVAGGYGCGSGGGKGLSRSNSPMTVNVLGLSQEELNAVDQVR